MTLLHIMGVSVLLYIYLRLPETYKIDAKSINKLQSKSQLWKSMLVDPYVLGSLIIVGVFNSILFAFYAEAPFVYIKLLGSTPSNFGLLGLIIAFSSILGGWISHQMSHHGKSSLVVLIGCVLAAVSSLLMLITSLLDLTTSLLVAIYTSCLLGIFISFNLSIPATL